MPNFTARPTSGTVKEVWVDPPIASAPPLVPGAPPRVLATEAPLLRHRATLNSQVEVQAKVGSVEGPLDSALGGNLFSWWFAEWPGAGPPSLFSNAGLTSRVQFTPTIAGHLTLVGRRANGGAVVLHFDAKA